MTNKISDLTALTAPAVGDLSAIVDVSDTSQAATGSTRKITLTNFFKVIDGLTALTAPLEIDETVVYDTAGTTSKKLLLWQNEARHLTGTTAQFDRTSSAALTNITGLTYSVTAGGIYKFNSVLHVTATANGGHKYTVSGTCTATYIVFYVQSQTTTGAPVIGTRATALDTAAIGVTSVFAAGKTIIDGYIVVNQAGTLTIQFAQNASHSDTSSVLRGSTFEVRRIS